MNWEEEKTEFESKSAILIVWPQVILFNFSRYRSTPLKQANKQKNQRETKCRVEGTWVAVLGLMGDNARIPTDGLTQN